MNREDARTREPGLPDQVAAAALLPAHRFLDPRTFTAVIAEAARKKGVTVREETPASGLIWSGKRVVGVLSGAEKIAGGIVINASGAWAGRVDERLPMRIRPVHGQILSLQGPKGGLRHNIQKRGAGGYITPRADGRVLVGATNEDFGYEKKVTPSGLRSLSGLVHDVMPHLAEHRVLDSLVGVASRISGRPPGHRARPARRSRLSLGRGARRQWHDAEPCDGEGRDGLGDESRAPHPSGVGQTRAAGRVADQERAAHDSQGSSTGTAALWYSRVSRETTVIPWSAVAAMNKSGCENGSEPGFGLLRLPLARSRTPREEVHQTSTLSELSGAILERAPFVPRERDDIWAVPWHLNSPIVGGRISCTARMRTKVSGLPPDRRRAGVHLPHRTVASLPQ